MARKTKAAVEAAPTETVDAVPAEEPTPTPKMEMLREAAKMELLAFDTLLRAAREKVAIQLSIEGISVRTNNYGDIAHGTADGADEMSPTGLARQAGLLMGAARALLAVEADASDF
jgi:hypothetical protein